MAFASSASSQLELDVVLRDGSTVFLRPIGANDAAAILAFYRGLSAESLHFRFLGMTDAARATAGLLAACERDGGFALGAELAGRLVGIAGFVRDATPTDTNRPSGTPDATPTDTNRPSGTPGACEPQRAEVAFAIADALQGHGLGTHLLERLGDIARDRGIRELTAQVLSSNARMLRVFLDSGFDVRQRREGDLVAITIALEPTDDYARRSAARAHAAAAASMRGFFEPKIVAVIGASRQHGKIGSIVLDNLRAGGFTGRIVPIHPQATTLAGLQAYPSIGAVPAAVDLAVIVVPADRVDGVVDECLAAGVKSLVIITAGFAEIGQDGRLREQALLQKVRAAGARLVGPNCLGVMNTDPRVKLNATFSPVQPVAGGVALSTQSGALGLALLDHASRLGLGVSTFISVGNKADVSGNDLLQYWAEDPRTNVILLYLESFGDPRQFGRIARSVARRKPVVVVKAGRSRAGARAAASHTGALAASDAVVDGLFRQAGVVRTATLEQFFDVAMLLAHSALPHGPRVGVLTNAGGPGILAADTCETGDLELPVPAESTIAALRGVLPPTASLGNPVDMIASASPAEFHHAMTALVADPGLDSLIVVYTPVLGAEPAEVAKAIADAAVASPKPVLVVWLSAGAIPATLAGLPVYRFPEAAAEALAHVTRYAAWRHRPAGRVPHFDDVREADARAIVECALARGDGWLTPGEAQALVEAVALPIAIARSVSNEEDAVRAAAEVGYPVVLKAIGPAIVHKTEVGGVALGLSEADAVRRAYRDFTARLGERMTGALVQQQVGGGVEMLAGIVVDPLFGPLIACGSGGVLVELLKDAAFRLHPLTETDAVEMLNDVKGATLLRGFRGAPPSDEAALRTALLRLSALVEMCPEIQELDVNPLIVHAKGVRVVDVRVRVGRGRGARRGRRISYAPTT